MAGCSIQLTAHDALQASICWWVSSFLGYPCCTHMLHCAAPLGRTGTSAACRTSLQQPQPRAAHGPAKRPPHSQEQDLAPSKVPTNHPCACLYLYLYLYMQGMAPGTANRLALVLLLSLVRLLFCLSIAVILRWPSEPSGWAASSDKRQATGKAALPRGPQQPNPSNPGRLARQKSSPPSSHLSSLPPVLSFSRLR